MQQARGLAGAPMPWHGPAHLRYQRTNGLGLLQPSQHRACPFRRSKDALQGPSHLPSAVRAPQQAQGPTGPAPDAWGAVGTLQQAPFADPLAARRAHAESLVRPSWTATTQWHLTTASQLELSTVDWRERLEKLAEESWTLSGVPSTNLPSGRLTAMAYGTAAMRGSHKPEMQDAHVTVQSWQTLQGHDEDDGGVSFVASRVPCSLAGVFDGHCGSRSARYSASRVSTLLARNAQLWEHLEGVAHPDGLSTMAVGGAVGALRSTFAQLEREILDEDRHKPPGEFDGTTALVGLQAGEHLFVANLGDSRAVLCRNGGAVRLSRDHTPDLPDERKRVEAVGGHVRQHRGVWRLVLPLGPGCGLKICAVSRALGDIDYKEPRALISAVPDVSHWPLNAHSDEFVIYASDGVWAVCTDQEAVECVQEAVREAKKANCTREQCAAVASLALQVFSQQRGSKDDITTVVGLLDWEDVPKA